MSCDAQTLKQTIQSFSGGSDERYRHQFNPRMIYTEGMKAVAETAEAHWLVLDIAILAAPKFAKAWMDGEAGIGVVCLTVAEDDTARMTLSLSDDKEPELLQDIPFTDFPNGEWKFFLGTDQDADGYLTTLYLPSEH
jgi:hypothetical protein